MIVHRFDDICIDLDLQYVSAASKRIQSERAKGSLWRRHQNDGEWESVAIVLRFKQLEGASPLPPHLCEAPPRVLPGGDGGAAVGRRGSRGAGGGGAGRVGRVAVARVAVGTVGTAARVRVKCGRVRVRVKACGCGCRLWTPARLRLQFGTSVLGFVIVIGPRIAHLNPTWCTFACASTTERGDPRPRHRHHA